MNNDLATPELTMLSPQDFEMVLNALPMGVRTTLYAFPSLFIAGGFIRAVLAGEEIKDIDIFTSDLSIVDEAVQFYVRQCQAVGHTMTEHETPCTITVKGEAYPAQFVNNIAYTIEQGIQQFDFTICQAALWCDFEGFRTCCTYEFIRDVAAKRLVYTAPDRVEAPGGSLWRAIKFTQRGYSITQVELAKLVARLVEGQRKILHDHYKAHGLIVDAEERRAFHASDVVRSFSMRGRFGGVY